MHNICFLAFPLQVMPLADEAFAFSLTLSPALNFSQGLVHFSVSELISWKSLSILMRVILVHFLTGGKTEEEKKWVKRWVPLVVLFHHERCSVFVCFSCLCLNVCAIDCIFMCLSVDAFTSLPQNHQLASIIISFPRPSNYTCRLEANHLVI